MGENLRLNFILFLCFNLFERSACPFLEPKKVIELAETAIQTSDAALDVFNQIMDQLESTDNLKQIATIIGDIKTFIIDGIDVYRTTPKPIIEWCDRVTPLLTAYNNQKITRASEQRGILIKTLDNGELIMHDAQIGLQKGAMTFNKAAGELNILENQLANNLDENKNQSLKQLIADLNGKVATIREFFEQFICTKNHIAKIVQDIGDFKIQTEETKTYIALDDIPELKDSVIQTTQKVIAKCGEFHRKYD